MHYPIQDGDCVVKESRVMMCPEEYDHFCVIDQLNQLKYVIEQY